MPKEKKLSVYMYMYVYNNHIYIKIMYRKLLNYLLSLNYRFFHGHINVKLFLE